MTVYFAQRDDGLIKIGYTSNPIEMRMGQLRCESKMPVTLLGTINGNRRDERLAHTRFAAHRVRSELFSPDRDILDFINKATTQPQGRAYFSLEK